MSAYPEPNEGKKIEIKIKDRTWQRWPIKTPVIMADSDLPEIILERTKDLLQKDDFITIAESVVAITQGRAFKFDEIKISKMAIWLSHFVTKVPYGIGLGRPQTMQLAINECGLARILLAAFFGGLGRLIGIRGLFYRVAGTQAALIDGPCSYTLPPYNQYATLGPKDPQKTAKMLAEKIGVAVAIVDANDIGTNCVGAWPKRFAGQKTRHLVEQLTRDNPTGQSGEQTPVLLIRQK